MKCKTHRRHIDPDERRALWEEQNRRCGTDRKLQPDAKRTGVQGCPSVRIDQRV